MKIDEILLKSNNKMITKQGKWADFTDDFHALFGYILGKYRLSKKLCSNYRPEFAKWSIYRHAIILWTTVDTLVKKKESNMLHPISTVLAIYPLSIWTSGIRAHNYV